MKEFPEVLKVVPNQDQVFSTRVRYAPVRMKKHLAGDWARLAGPSMPRGN